MYVYNVYNRTSSERINAFSSIPFNKHSIRALQMHCSGQSDWCIQESEVFTFEDKLTKVSGYDTAGL